MITEALANRMLDSFLRPGPVWVSLHTVDPGEAGASEVRGNGYRRQPAIFETAAAREAVSLARQEYEDMPEARVAFIGLWDAPEGGVFLWGSDRMEPTLGVPRSGILRIEPGILSVKMLGY